MTAFKVLRDVQVIVVAELMALAVPAQPPAHAAEQLTSAQRLAADPERKLALLHWQEVLLKRMTARACLMATGHEVEANRARTKEARDRFDGVHHEIREAMKHLPLDSLSSRQLAQGYDDSTSSGGPTAACSMRNCAAPS